MQEPAPLTWKGRLIASGIGLIILLFAAEAVLRIAMPHWREYYSGWFMRAIMVPGFGLVSTGVPGFDGYFAQNNGDFRVHIKINEFGLRNNDPIEEADGRIWVIGDSMTFGWGVEEDEIYSSIMSRQLDSPVFNIASPGTDICGYQALLSMMPSSYSPRAVVMGLILENDIREYNCAEKALRDEALVAKEGGVHNGSRGSFSIKGFLTKYTALYNFFAVSLKRVDIMQELLKSLGIILQVKKYKDPLSGGDFEKTIVKSVDEIVNFRKQLPEGTPFLVVIAPGRFELFKGDPLYASLRKSIGKELDARGIDFVDPFDFFKKAGYDPTHFAHDGHWTALGHQLAGEAAAARLSRMLKDGP